jgi:hypothetical protein
MRIALILILSYLLFVLAMVRTLTSIANRRLQAQREICEEIKRVLSRIVGEKVSSKYFAVASLYENGETSLSIEAIWRGTRVSATVVVNLREEEQESPIIVKWSRIYPPDEPTRKTYQATQSALAGKELADDLLLVLESRGFERTPN